MPAARPEVAITMPPSHSIENTAPVVPSRHLSVDHVRIAIGDRVLLDDVCLGAAPGEFVVVLGPSGSGKSSLLNTISGLAPLSKGAITLGGTRVDQLSTKQRTAWRLRNVGRVDQHGDLLPELDVFQNVALPLRLLNAKRVSISSTVSTALDLLGIGNLSDRQVTSLSGGEAQRVAIARAIVTQPSLILADEPTGALDEAMSTAVIQELRTAAQNTSAALVVVSHDPSVRAAADSVYRVRHQRLVPE